jgi:hypothetical protein
VQVCAKLVNGETQMSASTSAVSFRGTLSLDLLQAGGLVGVALFIVCFLFVDF